MANKNKNIKEPLFKDSQSRRWRFVKDVSQPWGDMWLMVRVNDGYHSYWRPKDLTQVR